MASGRCHCGSIQYEVNGAPMHHALCHCSDCRRHAGAPMVGWMMFKTPQVSVTAGTPKIYHSSAQGRRHFCAACGTGLFYTNEVMLPGITDVQSATLDDSNAIPPQVQIQTADRIHWMTTLADLPEFERFPPAG